MSDLESRLDMGKKTQIDRNSIQGLMDGPLRYQIRCCAADSKPKLSPRWWTAACHKHLSPTVQIRRPKYAAHYSAVYERYEVYA